MGIYLPLQYNAKANAQAQMAEPVPEGEGLQTRSFHIHVLVGKLKGSEQT